MSGTASLVAEYEATMRRLFLEGAIWDKNNSGSWTRHTLDQIKSVRVFQLGKGGSVTLSWPSDDEKQDVLGRIHARVKTWVSWQRTLLFLLRWDRREFQWC